MKQFGLYIHIPFCQSRCIYCDFFSTTSNDDKKSKYVNAVLNECKERRFEIGDTSRARTIYIGGGTPSTLPLQDLSRLLCTVYEETHPIQDVEYTIEINPDDVCPALISVLKDSPVNRISMGVQSLDNVILRFLHRRHDAITAKRAVEALQDAGYNNISLDLIYGLPGQSVESFATDLKSIINLGIPHLSAYSLQIEEGTLLNSMLRRGEIEEVDEEMSLKCYETLLDTTEDTGFGHYEISNFAKEGFESRHNSSYWQLLPYIGLGAGAHSFDGVATRRSNVCNLDKYMNQHEYEEEHLSKEEQYDELIMLSLRTRQGLSLTEVERRFGEELRKHAEKEALQHINRGTIQRTGETLRLTRSALFISDSIIRDLLAD